jgi:hypothetical protein
MCGRNEWNVSLSIKESIMKKVTVSTCYVLFSCFVVLGIWTAQSSAAPSPKAITSSDSSTTIVLSKYIIQLDCYMEITPYNSEEVIPQKKLLTAMGFYPIAGADISLIDEMNNPIENTNISGNIRYVVKYLDDNLSDYSGDELKTKISKNLISLKLFVFDGTNWNEENASIHIDEEGVRLETLSYLKYPYPFVFAYKETPGHNEIFYHSGIELVPGWNLISLPFQPIDNSIESLLDGVDCVSAWQFDSTNNRWNILLPGSPIWENQALSADTGLGLISEINAGEGIWLNCSASGTLNFTGKTSADNNLSYTSKGWNLIGLKGSETIPVDDLITVNDNVNCVMAWKWSNNNWNVFVSGDSTLLYEYAASKGFDILNEINPTEGFWIKSIQEKIYSNWEFETPPPVALYHDPGPPKDFIATPGDATITLSWTPFKNIKNHIGYRIQQNDGNNIIITDITDPYESSVEFTGLTNDKRYEYKINSVLEDKKFGTGDQIYGFYSDVISGVPKADFIPNNPPVMKFISTSSNINYEDTDIVYEGTDIVFQWVGDDSDGDIVGYLYSMDDDQPSSFTTSTEKVFTNLSKGSHTLYVKAKDNNNDFSEILSKSIMVIEKIVTSDDHGQLILVVGGPTSDYDTLWPVVKGLADGLYDSFINRGFTDDDIFFTVTADGVSEKIDDASPSIADLTNAISTWAGKSSKQGPLFIYLMDHGDPNGGFYLSKNEKISPAELKNVIDNFLLTNRKVILVIEACYAGFFKEKIETDNLVVISSSSKEMPAGLVEDLSFTKFFTMMIEQGFSIKKAFGLTKKILEKAIPPYSDQNPQIGDLSSISDSIYVAGDLVLAGNVFPIVTNASIDKPAPVSGEVVKLSADLIGNTENIRKVWAVITPPDFEPVQVIDYNVPDPNLSTVTLGAKPGHKYEAYYDGFVKDGEYQVVILAINEEGDIGISNSFSVSVNGVASICPSNVTDLIAQAGNEQVILTWAKDLEATGYKIYFKRTGSYYEEAVETGDVGSYTVTGLTNGALYTFKVTSIKEGCHETAGSIISTIPEITATPSTTSTTTTTTTITVPDTTTSTTTTMPATTTTTTTITVPTTTTTTTTVPVTTTTIPEFSEASIDLSIGWNLINSCLEPSDATADEILSYVNDNISSVWKWHNGGWTVYLPNEADKGALYANSKGFGLLEKINSGEGFWVNSNTAQTLNIDGTQPSNTSSSLTSGWNLAGLKSEQAKNITDFVSGNETKIASVWKWKNGKWAVYLPGQADGGAAYAQSKGFTLLSDIEPGEGFWVNALQAITLE